ncbi:MAG: phage adaptor protein [Candidatus Scalindua sp.]
MTLNIIDMRQAVLAVLPDDAKDILVERLMLEGIQDLCRETSCLIDPFTTTSVKDTHTYPLTVTGSLPSNTEIIGVWQGKYNNVTIPINANRTMDRKDRKWEIRTGTPTAIIYDGGTNIRYNVTPDTTGKAIQLEPILMPNSIDGVVPEKIEKRHQEAVKDYVRWKTYEKPGRYFNFDLAGKFENKYNKKRNALKVEIAKDGEELEVKPVSFVTGQTTGPIGFTLGE